MVVPVYEEEATGVYYNTAAVIDADGSYLGKYRKNHIPHCLPAFWEKFYFKPGNLGYPGVQDALRHHRRLHLLRPPLPRGRAHARPARRGDRVRALGHHHRPLRQPLEDRADRRWPSPTATSWAPTTAWAARRPGTSASSTARSYFCDPYGQILAMGSRDKDELVVADLDLDLIDKVRAHWQFYRDRRPETLRRHRQGRALDAVLDLVLKGGTRRGRVRRAARPRADVGIEGGAHRGRRARACSGREAMDCRGHVVGPGLHRHATATPT